MMTLAVMSQLRPRGNWYRIAREWIYGDAPLTELGRARGRVLRPAPMSAGIPPSAAGARGAAHPPPRTGPKLRLAMLALALGSLFLVLALSGSLSPEKVEDWVDGFGAVAPLVFIVGAAMLTCLMFPGPILAGASGPAVRHGARHAGRDLLGDARRLPGGEHRPLRRGRRGARSSAARASARSPQWVGRRGFTSVLYARIAPGDALQPRELRLRAHDDPDPRHRGRRRRSARAPRTFAYVALGGSFGDLSAPRRSSRSRSSSGWASRAAARAPRPAARARGVGRRPRRPTRGRRGGDDA